MAKDFFIGLHLVGHTEQFQDVLIRFITDTAKQRGHRELLLPVDVSIHHIVDVGCLYEFHPRALKGITRAE